MAINFSDTSSTETKLQNDDVILQESAQGLFFEIPLGSFIFNADYARDGQDLILSDDLGREVVIDGYFTQDQLPAISNEFGASVAGSFVAKLAGPGQVAQAGAATSSLGESVGAVETMEGSATVRHTDGTSEPLLIGDEIYKDDIIETASDGTLGILMGDGSVIGVGPGSRMTIDNFVYDVSSSEGSLGLSFLKGAVSFVSGKIAKNDYDDVDIKVPFGSIGIRGTEFVVEIGDDGIATVSVIQGAVAATVGGTEVVLNPGELISLAAAGLSTVETISVEAIRAKHSGVLDAQKKTQVIKEGRDEEGGGEDPA
ncbi:MAG: FecR domain-containing protein, partial [Pseudomonas marincola]